MTFSIKKFIIQKLKNKRFLQATLINEFSYVVKLTATFFVLYLLFFTDVPIKEDVPVWIVILELFVGLILCLVVFFVTYERFRNKERIKSMRAKFLKIKNDLKRDL